MRKFTGIFMALVFFLTMSIAPASHAAPPHDAAKAEQTRVLAHASHQHHDQAGQSGHAAKNDKAGALTCVDDGICKCIGGNCHSGFSKNFSDGEGAAVTLVASNISFEYANDAAGSSLSHRLKQPPKA